MLALTVRRYNPPQSARELRPPLPWLPGGAQIDLGPPGLLLTPPSEHHARPSRAVPGVLRDATQATPIRDPAPRRHPGLTLIPLDALPLAEGKADTAVITLRPSLCGVAQ
jgi:hypothetical protein